ncbi:hypothetical protein ABZS71_33090 [Streptomyces sp. NPDC005393]|uniref:hypothetical protein n=1 Tax=Streptomyces sp. NPDC005393 TaxID=3157041 RepID=UPI0033B04ABE
MRVSATGLTALLATPVLVLATSCGGGSDSGGDGKATPSADRSARSTEAASRLERAALAQGDLKGYRITTRKAENWASGQPKAREATCQPLADSTGDKPSPGAKETVRRGVNSLKTPYKGITAGLSTYGTAGAKSFMRDLRTAVAACSGGFATTLSGQTVSYREVRSRQTPRAGDDILAYRMTALSQGTKIPLNFVVVRSGPTIAFFAGVDLKRFTDFPPSRPVIDKQLEKLSKTKG